MIPNDTHEKTQEKLNTFPAFLGATAYEFRRGAARARAISASLLSA